MASPARVLGLVKPALPEQQAPLPHVVGTVTALRNLPHGTILRVQTGQAAQITRADWGHYLSYAGTDLTDSLDPTDLAWDRASFDSLTRMLPAVILDQPEQTKVSAPTTTTPVCGERHGHPDPGYMCLGPRGHKQ